MIRDVIIMLPYCIFCYTCTYVCSWSLGYFLMWHSHVPNLVRCSGKLDSLNNHLWFQVSYMWFTTNYYLKKFFLYLRKITYMVSYVSSFITASRTLVWVIRTLFYCMYLWWLWLFFSFGWGKQGVVVNITGWRET